MPAEPIPAGSGFEFSRTPRRKIPDEVGGGGGWGAGEGGGGRAGEGGGGGGGGGWGGEGGGKEGGLVGGQPLVAG